MSCIDVHNLTKSYGNTIAVDGIDLTVPSGAVFGFLGPNGAGKSTTIKLLTTLIRPSSGEISILGTDATKSPLSVRQRIGVVLQQPSYEPTLTVSKALDKYGMMWGVSASVRKKRVAQLLEDFDLVSIQDKRNEDLSIGQRRRVQVAREFMHDMDLLFLDEPTVGLDPAARRSLLDYLKEKVRAGLTIFYTTHVLTEAEYICNQIAVINNGKIIALDSPEELKARFGQEKTIKIHIRSRVEQLLDLLDDISDCTVQLDAGTDIIIQSAKSTVILTQVLEVLHQNNIEIDDLSAVPTNLEEIFLKMIGEK